MPTVHALRRCRVSPSFEPEQGGALRKEPVTYYSATGAEEEEEGAAGTEGRAELGEGGVPNTVNAAVQLVSLNAALAIAQVGKGGYFSCILPQITIKIWL